MKKLEKLTRALFLAGAVLFLLAWLSIYVVTRVTAHSEEITRSERERAERQNAAYLDSVE